QLAADRVRCFDRGQRLLPRLDRADEEEERIVLARRRERRIWGEWRDDDLVRRRPVQLDQIALRPFGDREHTLGFPHRATHEDLEDREVPEAEDTWISLPGEVLHGDDRRRGATQRQRMNEVRYVGAEPPQ